MTDCNRLCRKSLVCLDQIKVFNLVSCLCHHLPGRSHRTHTHDTGFYPCKLSSDPGSHRSYSKLLCLLLAHHDNGCRTVINTGGIGCGHQSAFLKCGTKLADSLCSNSCSRSLICIKKNGFFLFLHFYRNDLLFESAFLLCLFTLVLTPCRELVQLLSGQSPILCHVFSGNTHVIAAEGIMQCISKQRIIHLGCTHAIAKSGIIEKIGCL